jgi:hypothetical protein
MQEKIIPKSFESSFGLGTGTFDSQEEEKEEKKMEIKSIKN